MKIAIDKGLLVIAIDTAIKAVSSKTTIPILEGLLLEAEDNTLKVTGTDLEIGIQYEAAAEVIKPGKIVVNAKLLQEIIKKMPEEEIDLYVDEGVMVIESGSTINKLKTIDPKGYPALHPAGAKGGQVITVEQQDFKDLINRTVFAVAVTDKRPSLKGELIEISEGRLNVVACDGFMIASRSIKVDEPSFSAIIPGKTLSDISKVLRNGQMKIYKNGNTVLFECENFFATARTLEGEFIDFKRFIPQNVMTTAEIETNDLKSALETSIIFQGNQEDKRRTPIIFELTDRLYTNYTAELGEAKNEIKADVCGKKLKVGFNPRMLLETIRSIDDKRIRLEFTGKESPLLIRPIDGEKFMYLCLPVRLRE